MNNKCHRLWSLPNTFHAAFGKSNLILCLQVAQKIAPNKNTASVSFRLYYNNNPSSCNACRVCRQIPVCEACPDEDESRQGPTFVVGGSEGALVVVVVVVVAVALSDQQSPDNDCDCCNR